MSWITLGAILGGLGLFIVVCLLVLAFLIVRNRMRKRGCEDNEDILQDATADFELKKTDTLKEKLNALTDNVDKVYEEFRNIESLAKEEALEETTNIAVQADNRVHNRYTDIGQFYKSDHYKIKFCISVPYDRNIVTLQTPAG